MKRLHFFLLSILIYILTFIIIYHYVKRGMPTAVVIPVFAAGLLYGRRSGAVAALCAVPANIFLCMLMGLDWKDLALGPGSISGAVALIAIGTIMGYLSDLRIQLSQELTKRTQAEHELLQHQEKLTELVKEKTEELTCRNMELQNSEEELQAVNQELLAQSQELISANRLLLESQKTLKANEERLRTIIETASDAIIIVNQRGKVISWNKEAELIYGYTYNEISAGSILWLVPEHIRDAQQRFLEQLQVSRLRQPVSIRSESIGLRKNGDEFPMECTVSSWAVEEDIFYTFISRDITQRKTAENELRNLNQQLEENERALQQSEKLYRGLVETMNEGLIIINAEAAFTYANDAFCQMIGRPRDEIFGCHPSDLLDEENRAILNNQIIKRQKGGPSQYELTWLRKNGEKCSAIVSSKPVFDDTGAFQGSFAVITDITRRKQEENETREAKELFEKIFMTVRDGIIVTDNFNILRVNKAVEQMLGYREDEMTGKAPLCFSLQSEEVLQGGAAMVSQLYEKGFVENWNTEWLKKDGASCPMEVTVALIKNAKEVVTNSVGVFRDITERKKIEAQLLRTEKLRSLGELAWGVAHDFNNVLAAILGRAQLLKQNLEQSGGLQEHNAKLHYEMEKGLKIIESAALDGAATVRQIFDFSRQRDDTTFFTAVDLQMVIEGAVEFTRVRWEDEARLKNREYTLNVNLPVLPMAFGNAPELREVFINIIHNALDAMPQGGSIDITASADHDTIVIMIKDTGHGIPQPIIDRIFDPFFTTKGPQSTGLGMSVSYGILSRHNGTISVASTEGMGALFTITLPVTRVQCGQETQKPEQAPSRKASILVVDDEDNVRDVMRDILTAEGHHVECADCGKNAMELCEHTTYDIVFTDLGMPGMSGWQVAEAIKRIDSTTFVILLTGWDVRKNKSEIDKSKVDLIINKPFQINTILQVIKTVELRPQNQTV